jgi:serine/threonine protein phosphatase PrpC
MTKIQTVAKTHVGQVRDHNEDSFIVGLDPVSDGWMLSSDEFEIGDQGSVLIVADGMGGENAGEIAAEIAVQSIKAYIQAEVKKEVPQAPNKIMESAIIYAHNCIKDACRDNADYIGMGTTVTVCMLQKDKIYVSWIGDTRVYRYSKHGRVHALPYHFNNLEILSEDHSKVWQMMVQGQLSLEDARTHEQSNIITQSLGDLFRTPQPESREYPLFKDDHILICSDGLNGMLSDENMERIFTSDYESLR